MVDNVRLPVGVEQGAIGGPRFSTSIQTAMSGVEQRQGEWDLARGDYDISYGITSQDELDVVLAFYFSQLGPLNAFRFKDWNDYQLEDEPIGEGDSAGTLTFQIIKTYTNSVRSYERPIQLPVSGTVEVRVNDVLQSEGGDYAVSYTTGIITFAGGSVPVRFAEDLMKITMQFHDGSSDIAGQVPSIRLLEVIGE
jgi:uncharacterized protein (TIGR02217 family)